MWEERVGEWGPGLLEALKRIENPRKPSGVRHPLPAILVLSVCAMLGGARSLYAIAQWGREHPGMAQSLGFSREQTPCVATLHHLFHRLDVDAFESALSRPIPLFQPPIQCRNGPSERTSWGLFCSSSVDQNLDDI